MVTGGKDVVTVVGATSSERFFQLLLTYISIIGGLRKGVC